MIFRLITLVLFYVSILSASSNIYEMMPGQYSMKLLLTDSQESYPINISFNVNDLGEIHNGSVYYPTYDCKANLTSSIQNNLQITAKETMIPRFDTCTPSTYTMQINKINFFSPTKKNYFNLSVYDGEENVKIKLNSYSYKPTTYAKYRIINQYKSLNTILNSTNSSSIREYIKLSSTKSIKTQAREKLRLLVALENREYNKIKNSNFAKDYKKYITLYPGSKYIKKSKLKIALIEKNIKIAQYRKKSNPIGNNYRALNIKLDKSLIALDIKGSIMWGFDNDFSASNSVFLNSNLSYTEKIFKYAKLKFNKQLTPRRMQINKPTLAKTISKPVLRKDEFETTEGFKKRVSVANKKWKKSLSEIQKSNAALMKEYDQQLNDAELKYKNDMELVSKCKEKIYKETLQEAVHTVLGRPYFKDIKYNADSQTMVAVVFSARTPEFTKQVHFSVPLSTAKNFKSKLQSDKLIPLVELNKYLNIINVHVVTNEHKIALEYTIAKEKNTIKAYESFIREFPDSAQAQKSKLVIDVLKEEAKNRKLMRRIEAEEREKRLRAEKEADKQKYLLHKRVGDKVCKNGRVALGLIGVTITAYVEHVNGDSVQLRIASTEGQDIYYNGVPLEAGVIIWDKYYEWKNCY